MKAIIDGQVMEMSEPSWTSGIEHMTRAQASISIRQALINDERARCLAAVHKALADWPQVPSESTKRFAAMVIANIEGKS